MRYYLSPRVCLKWLELYSAYHIQTDELYELDKESFGFLRDCSLKQGCYSNDREFIDYCLQEGILVTDPVSAPRPSVIESPTPSLRYLELQITDRCNLKCRHCYIGETSSHELSAEQVGKVLREFEEMQGLRVMITGGEPLLHKDFHFINAMLPDFSIRKVLFSNGLLIDKTLLKGLHVDELQISIDGLQKAHDRLRGKGSFQKAMDAVHLCSDMGFAVSIATMVHANNLNDFEYMERLFREIGVKDWTVDVPCISGRLTGNKDLHVSPETGGKYLKYGFGQGLHGGSEGFGCGLHLISVMANGNVAKCTFYSDKCVGTLHDGLRECWGRISPVRLDSLVCDCAHRESCRGGCRYRGELLNGPGGKDLYKCFSYDIINSMSG